MPMISSIASAASKALGFNSISTFAKDAYNYLTTLLLKADAGTQPDTIKTAIPPFNVDSSVSNIAFTVGGSARPTRYTPYLGNYYSNQFTGTTDYLSIATPTSLALGSGNWTVECWILSNTVTAAQNVIADWRTSDATGGFPMMYMINAALTWRVNAATLVTGGTVPFGTWAHVALVKNGSTTTMYLNGTSVGSASDSITYNVAQFQIGKAFDANYFNGFISNFRVVVGTAIYTSNFNLALPTSPAIAIANTRLLTCQSKTFTDTSNTFPTITSNGSVKVTQSVPFVQQDQYVTYGSGSFNGTSDYILATTATQSALADGDFTVDCWVYTNTIVSAQNAIADWRISDGTAPYLYMVNASMTWRINSATLLTGGTLRLYEWTHVAVTRSAGVSTMYINGVSVNSAADNTVYTVSQLQLGKAADANYFNGYISDFRIIVGISLYPSNFTVPSTMSNAVVPNTTLLALQYSGSSVNNVYNDNSTTSLALQNFNAFISTQGTMTPFSSRNSAYFNGASYVVSPANAVHTLGTNDFTIEAWVYPQANAANMAWIASHQIGGMFTMYYTTTGAFQATVNNAAGATSTYTNLLSATTVPLNRWAHIAVVRNGNTLYQYINGVRDTTTLDVTTINIGTYGGVKPIYIGAGQDASQLFTGFISNVRYTNGIAVYTSNFTPSRDPLLITQKARDGAVAMAGTYVTLNTLNTSVIMDLSVNNFQFTFGGAPITSTFGPTTLAVGSPTPGYYSVSFNGTTDYLTLSNPQTFGTNAFTVEFWMYSKSFASSVAILSSSNNGALSCRIKSNTLLSFDSLNTSNLDFTVPTLNTNTWYHIVFVRDASNNATVFVNGVQSSSGYQTLATNYSGASNYLGLISTIYFSGYISNLRIYNGAAAYDPTQLLITSPTSPLTNTTVGTTLPILTFNDNIIDDRTGVTRILLGGTSTPKVVMISPFGANQVTYTPVASGSPALIGGTTYFNGVSGTYVTSAYHSGHQFGANDFTIECWVFIKTSVAQGPFMSVWTSSTATSVWTLSQGATAATSIRFGMCNGTVITSVESTVANTLGINRWIHVAVSRQATTVRMYANGSQVYTGVFAQTFTYASTNLAIGAYVNNTFTWNGFVSEPKITNGYAKYTTYNFIPTFAPQKADSRFVTFLLSSTNGGIYDSTGNNIGLLSGGINLTTQYKKYGTGSIVCSKSSGVVNTITFQHRPDLDMITGDFTIEFWIYPLNNPTGQGWIINKDGSTTLKPQYAVAMNTTGKVVFTIGAANANTVSQVLTSTPSLALNQWSHVACVRSGTTLYLWINGLQAATPVTQSITMIASSGLTLINNYTGGSAADGNDAYLDDVRITKGYARYTTPFTPPTALAPGG